MPTLETTSEIDVARIEYWFNSDSRRILFTVTQDGSPRDISSDDLSWALYEDPYDFASQTAVLSDSSADVDIVTSGSIDPTQGEFEIRVDENALTGESGAYWQRIIVDPSDDSKQSWRGEVFIEDAE